MDCLHNLIFGKGESGIGTLLSMPTKLLPIGNSILSYILQRMPSHITTVA
jgi:hypothetical protein